MNQEESIFRRKTPEELQLQLDEACVFGQALLPPSLDNTAGKAEFLNSDVDLDSLILLYKARVDVYKRILNVQRTGSGLTEDERQIFTRKLTVLNNLDR